MAAMLDFPKLGARLAPGKKCKPYGIVDLWVKIGAF